MCGFVAILVPREKLSAPLLDTMRDRLAHRGPDGSGSWIGDASQGAVIGLAHRRLAILDLTDAAAQPMFTSDRRFAIVYNGEIYNFVELREQLEDMGHRFRSSCDTEVLLACFEQWGPDCLDRLNGMFAFAIWDTEQRSLFVARDRFGEKPLFFVQLPGGGIAFASEMKALFAHPDVPVEANWAEIEFCLAKRPDDSRRDTTFSHIKRVQPAHAMFVDADGTIRRTWRYWTPDYTAIQDRYDDRAAVQLFREKLARSVKLRMRSDVPVGSSLSGGLDSSAVVGLLAELRRTDGGIRQNVFSARFDQDPTISEGPEIDAVVRKADVNAFSVSPDPVRLAGECLRLHWHQEEPFSSASIYLQFCVARLAQENGTIVLLDGQGADELLAGYNHLFRQYQLDLADRGQYWKLWQETGLFNSRLRTASRQFEDSKRRFDPEIAMVWHQIILKRLKRTILARPLAKNAAAARPGVPAEVPGMRLRHRMASQLQYNGLPTLLRYADRNAMAFGRETRFPFLDYDLVDWCVTLPDEALIDQAWQKAILRKAGEGILPEQIQWRADKVGYAAPLDFWLRGPMKDWAWQALMSGPVVDAPGYDRKSLEKLWSQHQSGARNTSWVLWRWISLNHWLTLMQDGCWRTGLDDSIIRNAGSVGTSTAA